MIKFVISDNICYNPNSCTLIRDNWDDFGFKTLFDLYFCDESLKTIYIGQVKVLQKGQASSYTPIPSQEFQNLPDDFCSLGQGQSYYEEFYNLPKDIQNDILKGLNDCVYNEKIEKLFFNENGFHTSLLRYLREDDIQRFREILKGQAKLTPFKFEYSLTASEKSHISINVMPKSTPPTNIQVIIGRNGVGKTRLLGKLTESIAKKNIEDTEGNNGRQEINPFYKDGKCIFSGLITVAFSAFDFFKPLKKSEISGDFLNYSYIGLKSVDDNKFITLDDLQKEFLDSFQNCVFGAKKERLINAINVLNSDPIFSNLDILQLIDCYDEEELRKIYTRLSSGHKIVLFTIIRLVMLTDERTLILIDEPETHLHPPLLSSFMRALSDLLINRNAVAIIATHSPVVLQEVPSSCVFIMNRIGLEVTIEKPQIETYAENVGTLTHEVFKLEVLKSGFYQKLNELVKKENRSYEEALSKYNNQIGNEGRLILRSLELQKNN